MSTLDIIISDKSLMLLLNDIGLSTANFIGPKFSNFSTHPYINTNTHAFQTHFRVSIQYANNKWMISV